ncbi:MAG: hypothetical protein LBT37_06170 [Lactobacillaceae bacterium]|jgi:hypothetical protein|nr:hypothetical protein [Lactobacillaceae bacterium]
MSSNIEFSFVTPDGLEVDENGELVIHVGRLPARITKDQVRKNDVLLATKSPKSLTEPLQLAVVVNVNANSDLNGHMIKIWVPSRNNLTDYVALMALQHGRAKTRIAEESSGHSYEKN